MNTVLERVEAGSGCIIPDLRAARNAHGRKQER
jgi:hypothetical protein